MTVTGGGRGCTGNDRWDVTVSYGVGMPPVPGPCIAMFRDGSCRRPGGRRCPRRPPVVPVDVPPSRAVLGRTTDAGGARLRDRGVAGPLAAGAPGRFRVHSRGAMPGCTSGHRRGHRRDDPAPPRCATTYGADAVTCRSVQARSLTATRYNRTRVSYGIRTANRRIHRGSARPGIL